MEDIFLILGSNPTLSVAEIFSVAHMRGFALAPLTISDEVMVARVPKGTAIDIGWFGGVVKWGRMFPEIHLVSESQPFGLSVYRGSLDVTDTVLEQQVRAAEKCGMAEKQRAKKAGVATRFVTSRQRVLSSVIVAKELLRRGGREGVWIVVKNKVLYGVTEAVQEFEEFGARDYGRPGADARSGMLPPKLAKIMVNLAGGSSSSGAGRSREVLDNARTITILDPFCGSGTILQEALLLGYNVIGADKSPSAVKDTEKNIRWLQNNFPVSQCPSFRVIQSDIRKLENYVSPFSIDAIVTEPLLGPAFRATPTAEGLKPTLDALTALSTDAFAVFEQLVRPGGHVVMIFPVFQTTPPTFLSRRVLPRIGWTIAHPLPEEFRRHSALTLTPSSMLLYGRPGQHVWREIGIFARSAKNN